MWVIAGVLLGLVVLVSLIGFHVGPHAHVAAGILGLAARPLARRHGRRRADRTGAVGPAQR